MNKIELIQFTDPYCTWCWASEPLLRKIQEVYQEQVRIIFKMGGLVERINSFYDPSNKIGGTDWYKQVAEHWLEASSVHKMPVDEQVFYDLKHDNFSTYPANIAYKSAQFQNELLANKYLRRMREAASAERKLIHKEDVEKELAIEVGLDGKKFIEDIKSGKAEEAFVLDKNEYRKRGIHGFPTFIIRNPENDEEMILSGFQRFENIESGIHRLCNNITKTHQVPGKDTILAFIQKYKTVVWKEVSEVFDITEEKTNSILSALVSEGRIDKKKAGNGFFFNIVNV